MKLHLIYDTATKQFTGGSVGGRILHGLSSVVLNNGKATVLNHEGRDLLAPEAPASPASTPAPSAVEQGIAACFGLDDMAPSAETDSADDIDRWDFNRWSSR
ncbi:hypothetical protein [Urbifossiella limnaea]|uniref:Uncharacterized protein n=1 Tax=Urbifossiella limnaea TaxID=2528023 RepID=A0A517XST4_9BACT|nr:hypothetical protein [Urbifossiella limnaea]QDU20569.1 hypothetical protein ETAA1_25240 [Urbifossiella limnaea]